MNKDIYLLSLQISAWSWQIISVIFLSISINFLIMREYQWMFGMVGAVIICLFMAFKRKHNIIKELENAE